MIRRITDRITCISVPFEDLYTSVYVVTTSAGVVLIDSATTKSDAERYILPALDAIGIRKDAKCKLLLTHNHGDHAGGAPHLLEVMPNLSRVALADGERIGQLAAITLPGHSDECVGYYDGRSGTLLSGDALQFYGIGRYGTGISDARAYERTLDTVSSLGAVTVVPSHEYIGMPESPDAEVRISAAWRCHRALLDFVCTQRGTAEQTADAYRKLYPDKPPIPAYTFAALSAHTENE